MINSINTKLAFSTLPCISYSAKELLAVCEKYNFVGAEVRTNDDDTFTHGDGLNITNVGSGICLKGYSEDALNRAKSLFRLLEENNVRAMRVFLGNFCQKTNAPRSPIDHDGIVKMLQEMCDDTTTEIWIETHNEYATGKVLKKLLEDVNRPNIKIIWDIIHTIEDGETPEATIAYLGDNIAHVHIKDGHDRHDPEWHDYEYTPLGEGELPIAEIVKLLEARGYKGYYSLEWESLWRPELKNLDWSVDKIMTEYINFFNSIM